MSIFYIAIYISLAIPTGYFVMMTLDIAINIWMKYIRKERDLYTKATYIYRDIGYIYH